MGEIIKLDNICQYNEMVGQETLHPLVSVIDLSKSSRMMKHVRMSYGFYAVFLKEVKCGDLRYGRNYYDYQEGTLVFLAPGQVIGIDDNGEYFQPKGRALLFHPDLIRGTSLGHNMKDYSFFSYEVNEALHLSADERMVVHNCLAIIRTELQHAIDRHTKGLICTNIELLLDYCMRFYERQFVTRQDMNLDVLGRFEKLIDEYLDSDITLKDGVPSVQYFADKVCLSPNYFGDLVKKETGKSAKEYIQLKMLNVAKEELLHPEKSITEVAAKLGFQYPQHFVRFFKRYEGITPSQYRQAN